MSHSRVDRWVDRGGCGAARMGDVVLLSRVRSFKNLTKL